MCACCDSIVSPTKNNCECDRPNSYCQSSLRYFHRDYYKSSPLWFIIGGTKALVSSSRMNTEIYIV
jgi:nicotinic acid mononucleotide adenylyltransferase